MSLKRTDKTPCDGHGLVASGDLKEWNERWPEHNAVNISRAKACGQSVLKFNSKRSRNIG
jgi:hypothetical protein